MTERPLFQRPIQAVAAVSQQTSISRFTIIQACQHGILGEDVYRSGSTWLIDTQGESFRQWLAAHEQQPRVKGRKKHTRKKDEYPP
jgi:hypothetical protein